MAAMIQLMLSGTILVFAALFLAVGIWLKNSAKRFSENAKQGRAVTVGFAQDGNNGADHLLVTLLDSQDHNTYGCQTRDKATFENYPIGTVLDVLYAPGKTMGIRSMEIHSLNKPPISKNAIGNGILAVSAVGLTAGIALGIVGLSVLL